MSAQEMQRLTADLNSDGALRDRLQAAGPRGGDAWISAACAAGYAVDKSDTGAADALSDAELEQVAGGVHAWGP